jgi:hypothetical protein
VPSGGGQQSDHTTKVARLTCRTSAIMPQGLELLQVINEAKGAYPITFAQAPTRLSLDNNLTKEPRLVAEITCSAQRRQSGI